MGWFWQNKRYVFEWVQGGVRDSKPSSHNLVTWKIVWLMRQHRNPLEEECCLYRHNSESWKKDCEAWDIVVETSLWRLWRDRIFFLIRLVWAQSENISLWYEMHWPQPKREFCKILKCNYYRSQRRKTIKGLLIFIWMVHIFLLLMRLNYVLVFSASTIFSLLKQGELFKAIKNQCNCPYRCHCAYKWSRDSK